MYCHYPLLELSRRETQSIVRVTDPHCLTGASRRGRGLQDVYENAYGGKLGEVLRHTATRWLNF